MNKPLLGNRSKPARKPIRPARSVGMSSPPSASGSRQHQGPALTQSGPGVTAGGGRQTVDRSIGEPTNVSHESLAGFGHPLPQPIQFTNCSPAQTSRASGPQTDRRARRAAEQLGPNSYAIDNAGTFRCPPRPSLGPTRPSRNSNAIIEHFRSLPYPPEYPSGPGEMLENPLVTNVPPLSGILHEKTLRLYHQTGRGKGD